MKNSFKDNLSLMYKMYPILKEINDYNGEIIQQKVHFKTIEAEENILLIAFAIQKSLVCIIPIEIVKNYLLTNDKFILYMYNDIFKKFNILIEKREDKNHKSTKDRIIKYLIEKKSNI